MAPSKTRQSILILLITCLVSLAIALPSGSVPRQPNVNVNFDSESEPRSLLGKPYGRRWKSSESFSKSQSNTPQCTCTRVLSLLVDIDADADPTVEPHSHFHLQSQLQTEDQTETVQLERPRPHPLPLVVNVNVSPESESTSRRPGIGFEMTRLGSEQLRSDLGSGLGKSQRQRQRPLRYTTSPEEDAGVAPLTRIPGQADPNTVIPVSVTNPSKCDRISSSADSDLEKPVVVPEIRLRDDSRKPWSSRLEAV